MPVLGLMQIADTDFFKVHKYKKI